MEFIENKPFDDCIGTEKRTLQGARAKVGKYDPKF